MDLYFILLQAKVGGPLVGIELIAVGDNAAVVIQDEFLGILRRVAGSIPVAARPFVRPVQAPLQRTHHTIIVHRGEPVLPVVHPLCVAGRHAERSSVATGARDSAATTANGSYLQLAAVLRKYVETHEGRVQ